MPGASVRLYGKEQISATEFCVADDMDVEISIPLPPTAQALSVSNPVAPTTLKFAIRFVKAEQGAKANSSWQLVDGVVRFTIEGWSNPLGNAFIEPFLLGDIDGRGIFVQVAHRKVGTVNNATWFVLLGNG